MSGVNICGFIRGDFGLAQAARGCALAISKTDVDFTIVDFFGVSEEARKKSHPYRTGLKTQSQNNDTWLHAITDDNPHPVNLLHFNPDVMQHFVEMKGESFFAGKTNIGYWHWELNLPPSWARYAEALDEVWCPTRFVEGIVNRGAPNVKTRVIPHCIGRRVSSLEPVERDRFVFLTMFNGYSSRTRKNPDATIEAFKSAFPDDDPKKVVLLVKAHNLSGEEKREMYELTDGFESIALLDVNLSESTVHDLEALCDVFVSLHRAEGFGLSIAECMARGKPCIATNYSGNVDFMSQDNACLVSAPLIDTDGGQWADPSVDEAARYMRALYENPEMYARLSYAARSHIAEHHNPVTIGAQYAEALRSL